MRAYFAAVVAVAALAGAVGAALGVAASGQPPGPAASSLPWSGLAVGVNDDSGVSGLLRDWLYPVMRGEGLRLDTLTVTWDESDPLAIPARAALAAAIAAAQADGIVIELDLYPMHSRAFTDGKRCKPAADPEACGDSVRIQEFAAWTKQVANAFPSVHEFVVMNECNQPRFLNPQWDASGQNQSAAICGRALSAAYTAIKSVDGSNFVWGLGLSPRGNDDPRAVSNSSTSPVRFLADLGAWFKAFTNKTHRATPLMDGFDFHPYPIPQSLPFATGYANRNDATIANLPRIYQAFYDAFSGSPQRTIGQQRGGGLPVSLNETGIQTASSDPTYVGWQTGAGAPGGVSGRWATQAYQARWYLAMLNVVACDPNIRLVNIFHLLDDASLGGWQSGLYFADQSPKLSAVTVQNWIATTGESCHGRTLAWRPGTAPTIPPIELSKLRLPSPPALLPPALAAGGQQTGVGSQADPIPAAVTAPPPLASPTGAATTDGAQPADTSSTGTTPAGGGASADTTPTESPQPGA